MLLAHIHSHTPRGLQLHDLWDRTRRLAAGRRMARHLVHITAFVVGELHVGSPPRQDSLAQEDATIPQLHENLRLSISKRVSTRWLLRLALGVRWAISLPLLQRFPGSLQSFNLFVDVIAFFIIF